MKNAMKKLFSLLLVAVLLVGVMPFQAFADGTVPVYLGTGESLVAQIAPGSYSLEDFKQYCPEGTDPDYLNLCHDPVNHSSFGTFTGSVSADQCLHLHVKTHVHTAGAEATCTTAQTCTTCGAEMVAALGHTAGDEATCTAAQTCTVCSETLVAALGHDLAGGKCSRCDYTEPTTEQEPVRAAITWQIKYVAGGKVEKSDSFTPNGETAVAKDILYYHVFNRSNAWREQYTVTKVHSKANGVVSEDSSIPAGDTVTFVLTPISTPDDEPDNTPSTPSIPSGSHSLKVWARIWIHETEHKTILLDTIDNLSGNAKIYQVVAANINNLEDQFPNGYDALHWYETVYHKNKNNEYEVVGTDLTVGDEDDVYVSLFSKEKLVVVNVHTTKGYGYDIPVRIEGFRVGDTVTYNDVWKAVQKYYNISSMSIYTYQNMENMLAGKDDNKTENIIVSAGDNTYEVFITGSRKSGAYTYTADSSNPKTGDAIFAPAIVMGASFTCLAVLFYLNKKRAY